MTPARITLRGSQHRELVDYLEGHPLGHERAAIVLFKRLQVPVEGLAESDRFIALEVIPFNDAWVTSSSPGTVAFRLQPLRAFFQRCEEEGLVFGFAHIHPSGPRAFSQQDEENELTLLSALANRNGDQVSFVAMLWDNHQWTARVRSAKSPRTAVPVRHVAVLGDRIKLSLEDTSGADDVIQARQIAAFGKPFANMLSSLRVGVVGCGGTGSPTATLLARSGVGELVLVDDDPLERSNLNRVRGLGASDVGKPKAQQLQGFIAGIGLPVQTASFKVKADENPAAVDALASCDVVFGCTDEFIARELLNTCAYAFAQAYVDMGLGGRVTEGADGTPTLRYHRARISTILPEWGECLFCQGVIRDEWIRAQYARRENPHLTEAEMKERYLQDGATEAPGIGPFTSAAADFAVATLFDLLKPFRRFPGEIRRDMFSIDFVTMEFSSVEETGNFDCEYCGKRSFVGLKETSRLNRPFLGKRDVHV